RATLDAWFLNAATFWVQQADHWLTNARFPGRNSDNYSSPTDQGVGGPDLKKTHYNGFQSDGWIQAFGNNRLLTHFRLGALVGIMLNNTYLKDQGKRYVKESINYGVFSDGTLNEFYRWEVAYPTLGWTYAALSLGSMLTIADAFARTGDFELYNYS